MTQETKAYSLPQSFPSDQTQSPNYLAQTVFHEPSRKIKESPEQFISFQQETSIERNGYQNVAFMHPQSQNINFQEKPSIRNLRNNEQNQNNIKQETHNFSNYVIPFDRKSAFHNENFNSQKPFLNSLEYEELKNKLDFWETLEGQAMLELAVAGLDGLTFKKEPVIPTKDTYLFNKQQAFHKIEYEDQNLMKKIKLETSQFQPEYKAIPKQNTFQFEDNLLKKGLHCKNNPSDTLNSILSTDESDQSELSFVQSERSNSNVNLDSICSTPSQKLKSRSNGPKGLKPHIPGLMFNRVKASWKELLANDDRNFVEDEVQRLKYLSELLSASGIGSKEQRRDFLAFINMIKSAQTWNNIEKSLVGTIKYSQILLMSVITFLSNKGQIDFQDWIQNGRMGIENQRVILEHKEWFREKFGTILKTLGSRYN